MQSTDFPCTITISIPFPNQRLSNIAARALQVDEELSPLVKRSIIVVAEGDDRSDVHIEASAECASCIRVDYAATTDRMLRVALNGFFESLGVVIEVMEQLDVGALAEDDGQLDYSGVQGLD